MYIIFGSERDRFESEKFLAVDNAFGEVLGDQIHIAKVLMSIFDQIFIFLFDCRSDSYNINFVFSL